MPRGEKGPHGSRHGKDEASDKHGGDWDGRKVFSQVTQVTGKHCSPGPWMGLSRHFCQSPGETGAKAALHLPATAAFASIAVLWAPTTRDTLGVLYF